MRVAFALPLVLAGCAHTQTEPVDMRFDNGMWYRGGAFVPATVYVEDGKLRYSDRPLEAQQQFDLAGGFVVPPFCEGHNHNFGGSLENVEQTSDAYLASGVFYALMAGSFEFYRDRIEDRLNTPQSVDVVFANNGLTGPGGHPRGLRESLKARFDLYPEFSVEELADRGYFEAANSAELRRKWDLIRAERPDLVKVMLYFSEEYDERKDNPEYFGRRGLDPALLPELIALARTEGLRVMVHVESEADMVTALEAGADIIAHLPSYDAAISLSENTVALAASNPGTALVTTFSLAKRVEQRDPALFRAIVDAQRDNLQRLAAAGATIVVGSDNTRDNSIGEIAHLRSLDAVSNRQLLDSWTTHCASTLFPGRKVGRLDDGFEASFLVLDGNPLEDFDATQLITLRVKQGSVLPGPD